MYSQIYTFKFRSKILLRYNFNKLIDSVLFGVVTDLLSVIISAAIYPSKGLTKKVCTLRLCHRHANNTDFCTGDFQHNFGTSL